ncbi:hypothetical protein GCM10010193_23410 [Kitasatospora atroaurantiaca]
MEPVAHDMGDDVEVEPPQSGGRGDAERGCDQQRGADRVLRGAGAEGGQGLAGAPETCASPGPDGAGEGLDAVDGAVRRGAAAGRAVPGSAVPGSDRAPHMPPAQVTAPRDWNHDT